MSSTRTRLAAAAVVSATALSGAALVATPATAHARHHQHHARINTHLSIHAARRTAINGAADTIFGHLGSHGHRLVNQDIVLQDRLAGSGAAWAAVGTDKTNRHGNVRFTVTPTAKTRYRLRYAGNANFQPAKSKVVTIGVRNTGLSISASSTSVDPGGSVTIDGVLDANGSPAPGQTITLRDRPVGTHHFSTAGTATTGTNGDVSFTVTPATSTFYKLVFAKNGDLDAAHSRTIEVVIKQSSSLSSRIRATRQGFVVSGTLRGGGHALHNRKVTLLASTDSGSTWTAIRTKRTNRHGYVAYRVNPPQTTEYELSFAGGRAYDGCTSLVATATVS